MNLQAGERLGSYRILRLLGRGGMGAVYEAEHVELGTRRALKVFTRPGDQVLLTRFLAEGRLLARLTHPRLVRVYDLGVDETSSLAWFAMDLVLDASGAPCTLEDARRAGQVTEAQAAAWYVDLREALTYVHEQGVTHRDVKLGNILVDREGHAVLSDFGVSRILDPVLRSAAGLSTTATFPDAAALARPVLGTLGYLAPEVRAGEEATPASDLYAFGISMFRLLTGIWYEPGTDVLALLEPFEYNWSEILPPLLATDASTRAFRGTDPAPRQSAHPLRVVCRLTLGALVIVLIGTLAGWAWLGLKKRKTYTFESLYGVPSNFIGENEVGEGGRE